MHREQMVEALVIDSLINILDRERLFWLHRIFEDGFPGFARMSDDELRAEIARRGLDSDANDTAVDDAHCADDDADAHGLALSGLERSRRDARAFDAD
jgi:hypothetical protein